MNKIIFCDRTSEFSEAITQEFSDKFVINNRKSIEIRKYTGDIQNLTGNNYAYFSPANSFLFFDGGVDKVYWKMFRDLQKSAQKLLLKYHKKTTLGRNYLPIGSSLIVEVDDQKNQYVIACPTMFRPQDIRGTRNVYYAFLAGLRVIDKYNSSINVDKQIRTLVCPGLGTGYGKMTFQDSAKQIKEAFVDYLSNNLQIKDKLDDIIAYIDEPNQEEQSNVYENMELKTIKIDKIIMK